MKTTVMPPSVATARLADVPREAGPAIVMPRGEILLRPRGDAEDAYPALEDGAALRAYFERTGFVVLRRALPPAMCEAARLAFLREALPDRRAYFKRHASGRYERHVYTEYGHMKHPILNLQDIPGRRYPEFRQRGLELLTQLPVQRAMQALFGEPGRLVHTMYFDGNQTTWAHRDGDYFDSAEAGRMVGIWIAAEDIHPDAGRFYVVPGSHRQRGAVHADPNGRAYKTAMADFVRNGPLDCVAPVLRQGDAILWAAWTVHGSLPSADARQSRRSFTGHYLPLSHQLRRPLSARQATRCISVNNVDIALHQDHDTLLGKMKEVVRTDFPLLYQLARTVSGLLPPRGI